MTDIPAYALKSFPFSRDGIKEDFASAGDTIPIPEHLFNGLNDAGYVRRADIGDGHFQLRTTQSDDSGEGSAADVNESGESEVTDLPKGASQEATADTPQSPKSVTGAIQRLLGGAKPTTQSTPSLSTLSEEETAALATGSWKKLKFFTKRAIAAKVSDKPIKDGADADAAIEAYIANQKA